MYKRLSAVLFPIMTLLLIGAAYWGYQEHQEKNSILLKAENQYQRAFHDLTYHVQQLHQQLGNTLAVNSTSQGFHRKGLVNVWRLTSEAQNEINQLPLTLLPFNKAEDFLSRIANFAYKTSVRDLTKQPLSKDEFSTLKTLYAKSEEISNDLQTVQDQVLGTKLRWMDVETALAAQNLKGSNGIIDGFKTMDKKVSEYPEINWGPSVSSMYQTRSVKMLGGKLVTADDIKKHVAEFVGQNAGEIKVIENGKGTQYASYSASVTEPKSGKKLQMDYTQKGGQLIWFMDSRDIGEQRLDTIKAKEAADKFLNDHGFKGMQAVTYDTFNNAGTLTYVASQNGVLIYPEKLTVKIALDNGEAVGLQANDYVYEHHARKIPDAKVTQAEARKALNPEMKVSKEQKAIILNDLGEEVLCYEYTGKINGSIYRIYINAESGVEESIEEMSPQDRSAAAAK
ncbi:germination protein YpeB [Paenibacillus radicis (ex Gao et al. 2016)]|uniref:Germination protein YpeB n=1 Tax=Paenibacillus radicis (ex Gao et al. 2016) TaxID=1737354 RepID=A0A917LU32_9BACL|nr:germination protein YpeB [Paenibacillus radicis (ex Gao et al. 2016)]GGG57452.1 germination protein YpeB [Paenibacillus radicis (ex Gao et al. 2016)]